jgi:hypothetical protein
VQGFCLFLLLFLAFYQFLISLKTIACMLFLLFQQALITKSPIGKIIDDLELFICCGEPEDCEGRVLFIPFP